MRRREFLTVFGFLMTTMLATTMLASPSVAQSPVPAPPDDPRPRRRERDPDAPPRRRRRERSEHDPDRPRRPPTPRQLAARERFRQCGAEWRALRDSGRTEGRRWRDFRRDCLRRLRNTRAT